MSVDCRYLLISCMKLHCIYQCLLYCTLDWKKECKINVWNERMFYVVADLKKRDAVNISL